MIPIRPGPFVKIKKTVELDGTNFLARRVIFIATEITMIKVTAAHLNVDLNHTDYRIIWENLTSNATINLEVRVRRRKDEIGNYLDYSELEGMHLALADARVQIQQLIGCAAPALL